MVRYCKKKKNVLTSVNVYEDKAMLLLSATNDCISFLGA